MSFRIFLLALSLCSATLHAQETSSEAGSAGANTNAAPPAAATSAPDTAQRVPLDPADLLKVNAPHDAAERDTMLEHASQLRAAAKTRRDAAEQAQAAAQTACWKKFLVSDCLADARVVYRKELSQARHEERQAKTLERNVRKYDAAEHIRQRDEENARRDAENAKKAEEYRAKRAAEIKRLKEKGVPLNPQQ